MKNYKEEVKTIRNGWIQSTIKMIEEDIKNIKPWEYVICKDGKPRIGRSYAALLSLENVAVPEIIKYFRKKGFIIEVNMDNSIIYLEDSMLENDTLYQKAIKNLERYAYSDWPSNWPKAVNAMLIQKGIKLYNKPEDIEMLYEFVKNKVFKRISIKMQHMVKLTLFSINGKDRLGFVNEQTDSDKIIEDFFEKQGFYLENKIGTIIIMPSRNEKENGIIKYCYEEMYNDIASHLTSRMDNEPFRKAEHIYMKIHVTIPKEVEDMLKSDGFVIKYKTDDSLIISLL